MGWRDRLPVVKSPDANCANSAKTSGREGFGTFGSFGIEGETAEAPREAAQAPAELAAPTAAVEARAAALSAAFADPEVQADHAAIMADAWPNGQPARTDPPADLVQRLAVAMAAPRPWRRVTDPVIGLAYFRGQAHRRLEPLDPLARGLLVQAEEADARRHGGQAG
jgi:hypothetical protein